MSYNGILKNYVTAVWAGFINNMTVPMHKARSIKELFTESAPFEID